MPDPVTPTTSSVARGNHMKYARTTYTCWSCGTSGWIEGLMIPCPFCTKGQGANEVSPQAEESRHE